jgi:prolyl 4-hydroxylase
MAKSSLGNHSVPGGIPVFRQVSALLSNEECRSVIDAARPWMRPSAPVVGPMVPGPEAGAAATTRVACLPEEEAFPHEFVEIAAYLRTLVADLSGLPEQHQELFQVVHQVETAALDPAQAILFPGWEFLKFESDSGGDRVFSFILYLNDVEEGGESDCQPHGIRVRPEAGKAAFWQHPAGQPGYGRGLHASRPVTRGEKWALACWVREAPCRRPTIQEIDTVASRGGWNIDAILRCPSSIEPPAWLARAAEEQRARTPYLGAGGPGCRGIERRTLDASTFADIRAKYASVLHSLRPEADQAIGTFLQTVSREAPPALLHIDPAFNRGLLERLQSLHEDWCGLKLEPSACYGFRVYLPGAYLHTHVDSEDTHIVSSAICVDKDVRVPWPLHVVDIDGRELDVDLEPGEFVLYESAKIFHGRPTPLKGRYHVGLFLHYRPISRD